MFFKVAVMDIKFSNDRHKENVITQKQVMTERNTIRIKSPYLHVLNNDLPSKRNFIIPGIFKWQDRGIGFGTSTCIFNDKPSF